MTGVSDTQESAETLAAVAVWCCKGHSCIVTRNTQSVWILSPILFSTYKVAFLFVHIVETHIVHMKEI